MLQGSILQSREHLSDLKLAPGDSIEFGTDEAKDEVWIRKSDKCSKLATNLCVHLPSGLRKHFPFAPATHTNEQIAQILTVSLQSPVEHGVKGSHWTSSELARQAVAKGITQRCRPPPCRVF